MRYFDSLSPTSIEAGRIRYDDPCTNTADERAAARAYITRHARDTEDAATLLDKIGLHP